MSQKPEMLSSVLTPWIMAAAMCAALPFLRAVQSLPAAEWFDSFLPLLIALVIGIVAGTLLTSITRRLCGLEGSWRFPWETLTPGSAALAGIIVWGLPLGLVFAVDDFLRSGSWPLFGMAVWPLMGAAFGVSMRWISPKNEGA